MAIRIKLHGLDIETDSAAEAVEIYRQLGVNGNGNQQPLPPLTHKPANDVTGASLSSPAKAMLRLLLSKPEGAETGIVAVNIGVNGPKGLANPTRQIREWGLSKFGLAADACIRREDRKIDGALVHWTILAEPLAQKIRSREKELLG